ncbi:D-allose transport system permease protein AlsC [Roseibaca ekhonensis]|jgi:ribose transport system permease protein|uniref:Autoinducer 2 import system permease protein LsrD n=1 Tax=Roseinatronobacter ekhonensis TaxID=254356 RepID=A0A3B0MVI7_9RHOB|nr:ABC transporter permease [Roseibaca ekhonensis]SUZ32754.1 D-allose transport system permease protein AlsC [Roseibaca ekhonensis]
MTSANRKDMLKRGAIWGFILLELAFFSIIGDQLSVSDQPFLAYDNMLLVLKQSAPIGIIALGMTIVMINGNIDLSVGATFALAAIVMLDSMTWPFMQAMGDWAIPLAWLFALATGVIMGAINGIIVWKTGVDAFIVTLGAMLGFRGIVFMFNGEQPTSHLNWTLVDFAEAQFLGLHTATWFLLGAALVLWLLMTKTVHGRNAYAIGNNREAAVNAGIRVGPHFIWNFMLIGFLAALSAVVFYSESGSVNPNDGMLYELWAITAVVLGGTKLAGGYGSIISTLGGVIAIQLLRKGLGHIGADTQTVNLVIGLILIAVLVLDRQLNRKGQGELKI